ncbi:MAG: radical SAM protein [Syntrophobacteraceae bacterium]
MNHHPHDLVKSCRRLESGLRLGQEGIHACQLGQLSSPIYWSADEASQIKITREMIVEKRKWLFGLLNDEQSDISCKGCRQVRTKRYEEVDFTKLGRIDLAATTICNLRCAFCGYAKHNDFNESKYDALAVLKEFAAEDVVWDSAVDFNGGEPALLPDIDEYLDYFASRRIRVLLYTNAVKFRQSIHDGLANGSIQWVCTSLDAGSPSSFMRLKKRDHYLQVVENLSRYAHAGSRGGGMLAVKYIFCDDNCGDDDIAGFTYAMLAVRPQKVWLTFDFEPLTSLPGDSPDFGGYDYSKHIAAYAKMYGLMKKHGLTPVHYTEGHLAAVSRHGKILLENVLSEIERSGINGAGVNPDFVLRDFRQDSKDESIKPACFATTPLRIKTPDQDPEPWSLRGKRVVLAPAYPLTTALMADPEIREGNIVGFLDRDPVLRGKSIEGVPIYGYEAIPDLDPDVILVAPPGQHRDAILQTLNKFSGQTVQIVALDRS